ncbi:chloride channel protein [Streptococcus ictaluri]|uniref:Chloride transporter, ClC domain protein n=1 Tax=Streptococcus ictaluri 707-05 TaxID=764299 RepID=G5K602_9STRE|nr:chloride transporter, ClC domain protein [Streptococcus ictaluri 707-05]
MVTLPKRNLKNILFIYRVFLSFAVIALLSIFFPQILGNGKAGLLFFLHEESHLSYIFSLFLAKSLAIYLVIYSGAKGGKIAPSMMLGGACGLLLASFSNHFLGFDISPVLAIIIGASLFLGIINDMFLAAPLFLIEITGQSLTTLIPILVASLTAFLLQKYLQQRLLIIPKKVRS